VHPEAGVVRTAYYRDKPGQPTKAVPIWLFGR
jgi:hypothetical protein